MPPSPPVQRQPAARPTFTPRTIFGKNTPTPHGNLAGASEPSLLLVPPSAAQPNGTLLAVAGGGLPCVGSGCPGIDLGLGRALVLRRSADRGATWSPVQFPFLPFSNYTTVGSFFQNMLTWDSVTREVVLTIGNITYAQNTCNHPGNAEDADGMLQIRSADAGITWSKKAVALSKPVLAGSPTHCLAPTTGHGVCMDNAATPEKYRGRLLMVGVHNAYHGDVIIRSDDHGKTYSSSLGLYLEGLDEGSIAQLPNGSLAAIMRNCMPGTPDCRMLPLKSSFDPTGGDGGDGGVGGPVGGGGGNRFMWSVSNDGGETWTAPRHHPDLVTPVCMGSLTGYKDALYFAGPYSETARHNLTVLGSHDNGQTFSRSLLVWPSIAGYTGLQCGLPGRDDCAVLFDGEGGECAGICFTTFSSSDVV